MSNIKAIKQYFIKLDSFYEAGLIADIERKGALNCFNDYLKYLDCSRISNGLRLQQTIGFPYQLDMTRAYIIATKYLQDESEELVNKLVELHNKNLEFEKDNPPIIYDAKKKTNKKERTTTKREKKEKVKLSKDDKVKLSLAKKAKTFSTLKFTFKPVDNGNNNTI